MKKDINYLKLYNNELKVAYSIANNFYQRYKSIYNSLSMNYDDLIQEVNCKFWKSLKYYLNNKNKKENYTFMKLISWGITNHLKNILKSERGCGIFVNDINGRSEEEYLNFFMLSSNLTKDTLFNNSNLMNLEDVKIIIKMFTNNYREYDICAKRILEDWTYKELGKLYGLSRARVEQIYKKAMRRFRDNIKDKKELLDL